MASAKFAARRLGACLISLLLLSFVIFSLLYLAPGDPARSLVGVRKVTPELLEAIREQYHLHDPFFMQYFNWIKGAVTLNFGNSIKAGYSVTEYIAPHTAVTFELVGLSLLFSIILGVSLGVVSARNKNKLSDKIIDVVSLIGTSAPSFAIGLILLYIFSYLLGIFPMYGIGSGNNPLTLLYHLMLPAITLTIGVSAVLIKITRAAMLREVNADYITFLRARAIGTRVQISAGLRNASTPILTSTGLVLTALFGSTVLIEHVFSIPGLGELLTKSVTFHDVPTVQFIALMLASIICVASAVIDILVHIINPSTRITANA